LAECLGTFAKLTIWFKEKGRAMGKKLLALLIVAGLAGFYGCIRMGDCCCRGVEGSGVEATEARQVAGFESVALKGSGRLIIEQAQAEGLTVTADDNILPLLKGEVQGGELRLGPDSGVDVRPKTPIVYRLTVRNLSEVKISGSAKWKHRSWRRRHCCSRSAAQGTLTSASWRLRS
jgi:hypothetical protein